MELMQSGQDRQKRISDLTVEMQALRNNSEIAELKDQLLKIQEAAYSQIVDREQKIAELTEKLEECEEDSTSKNLKGMIVEFQEKYRELQQRLQTQRIDAQHIIQAKQEELDDLKQKFQSFRERSEQRIQRLEQDIINYESHIDKINEEKYHEQSIEQKYYLTEDKLRKAQKKNQDLELAFKDEKVLLQDAIGKLEHEIASYKEQIDESKATQSKVKELEKQLKQRTKEVEEARQAVEKLKGEHAKKYTQLESQKKKIAQTMESKSQELQRLRLEMNQRSSDRNQGSAMAPEVSPWSTSSKQQTHQSNGQTPSPTRKSSKKQFEQALTTIQKLKGEVKDHQEHVALLNKKLHQQTRQIQQMRQKLFLQSGSASRSEIQAKLMVEIEDLSSHIKKMENHLMINKLKHAEDQSYWNMKEEKSKRQVQETERQYKKQKAELLERIDRMKKNTIKDKKMDYYQTSLK